MARYIATQQGMTMSSEQPPAAQQPRGFIYHLRVGEHVKIDWTKNLHQRMRAYPPTSELLGHHYGTKADERALHLQFAAYLAGGREWFRDVPELRQHIEQANRTGGWEPIDAHMLGRGRSKPGPSLRARSTPRGRGRVIR